MQQIRDLPVYRHKAEILKALKENQVLIVESPTGSGKTTQLPLILKEAGYDELGIIGITQPRRIATLSICDFIKRQLEIEADNHYCAYTMRFDDTSDATTRIKIMTDGILLQEMKANPYLSNYSVIMVDEAHERSLNIDFILGLLKQITEVRPELKIIISSATINTQAFSAFFNNAPIISIQAGAFPVEIKYTTTYQRRRFMFFDQDYQEIAYLISTSIENNEGDILVFLPGEYDILQVADYIKPLASKTVVYLLYGRLSKEEQEKVFTPTPDGKTKIVISTNIAETSITIDGIKVVIDSGLAKTNFYNQKNFTSSLESGPISKSSAIQRSGRAGRTQPGICYRLYSQEDFDSKKDFTVPEILRSDLAEVVLRMSELGIYDYEAFPFITRPKDSAIRSAEETLYLIDAIDKEHHLTKIGEQMVLFPLLPRHARVIVEAIISYPEILKDAIIAISFLSTKSPFLRPNNQEVQARQKQSQFQDPTYGDFVGYLHLFSKYSAVEGLKAQEKFCKNYFLDLQTMNEILHIEMQLEEIISDQLIPITTGGSIDSYLTCLAAGLIQFVCYRYDHNSYRTITASEIYIHPGSSWFANPPKFILAGEIVQTSRMFARSVSPLKKEYLDKINPTLYSQLTRTNKEEKKKGNETKELEVKLFNKIYPYLYNGGKVDTRVAIVPLSDLPFLITEGYKKGKVKAIKIALSVTYKGNTILGQAIKLKDLIQEGSIIVINSPLSYFDQKVFNYTTQASVLNAYLNENLFRPIFNKKENFFGYLGLDFVKRGSVSLRGFTNIAQTLDSTLYCLDSLRQSVKDKELKATVDVFINKINMLEDF